jgi:RNA polymerase sigma-70 factor (ECF subfamily)
LCAFANTYLQDLEAAEETVQAFFVKFWETRDTVNIKTSPRSYIYTAVKNACLNQIKHIKIREDYKIVNQREKEESQYSVDDEFEAKELDQKIRSSIELLPEGRKRVFMMSRFEGLKYKEIAEKLEISIKTVENQMGSALKYLKSELSDYLVTLILVFNFLMNR